MTHHTIILDRARGQEAYYGICYRSRHVFRGARAGTGPLRLKIWYNAGRPNPRNGQAVRYGDYGPVDGGNGRYLDPNNRATDNELSFLIGPEATVICADTHRNTGQEGSGQVYAGGAPLRDGDTATLDYPSGIRQAVTLHFPQDSNGYGYAVPDKR